MLFESDNQYRTIVVVDIAKFTDPARTGFHQRAIHEGLYDILRTAFDEAAVHWKEARAEDRGDGAIILVRPEFPKLLLAERLPERLHAGLRRHNAKHAEEARFQLRVALHAGEIHENENGLVSPALNLACRLVDAPRAKSALRVTGAMLAIVASELFYEDVIRHEPGADPEAYREIDVSVKQTQARAWLRLPGTTVPDEDEPEPLPVNGLFEVVEALLAVPFIADETGRRELLDVLRPDIRATVPYHSRARLHVIAMVRTCEGHDDGLTELVTAVRGLEGDTPAVRRLVDVARRRLSNGNH
ncbi:hypothetical protein [Amycolatopsis sp. NPDC059657]|uniref:effector-associated domain 2-containing protein n=1 Tax=Amycolatopsis sp. NPDC059657 TaxID=3346899 RepID=UPI00366E0F91